MTVENRTKKKVLAKYKKGFFNQEIQLECAALGDHNSCPSK